MCVPFTFGCASFLGCSRTRTNAAAYKKNASLGAAAILGHAESDAGHRNACVLRVLGMYMRSGSWIGLCIVIGARSSACVGRWVPIRMSLLAFARDFCIPDLPRFLLSYFYYVLATEALLVLRVRPQP
jgi:hypothetical protein